MVFVKGGMSGNKKPRMTIKGRLVGFSSDEKGTVNSDEKLFNYIDALLMQINEDGSIKHKVDNKGEVIKGEDGKEKVEWLSVRLYPSKEKIPVSLKTFPEIVKADNLCESQKDKEVKTFPVVSLQVYKTLNESKDGIVYHNYKASLADLEFFKVVE